MIQKRKGQVTEARRWEWVSKVCHSSLRCSAKSSKGVSANVSSCHQRIIASWECSIRGPLHQSLVV